MSYHDTAMRQEHDYGDIIQSVNFEENVFKEIDSNHLKKGLMKFFIESQKFEQGWGNKKARMVGERLAKGQIQETPFSKQEAIELVEEAIEEAYIWDFKLKEPWHPAIFFDENRLTTLPWQHNKAVLYTGRKEYEFYSKEFLEQEGKYLEVVRRQSGISDLEVEDLHNAESVLKTGYLKPGVQHAQDEEEAKRKVEERKKQTRTWGIFLHIRLKNVSKDGQNSPTDYAGNNAYRKNLTEPVLEVELPTKFLRMPSSEGFISNPKEFFNEFSNVSQFKPFEIQYTNTHDTGGPALPLNYINGVWDVKSSKHPYFVPLEEYVNYLYDNIGKRLPEGKKLDTGAKSGQYKRRTSKDVSNKKWCQFEEFVDSEISGLDYINKLILKSAEKVKEINQETIESKKSKEFKSLLDTLYKLKRVKKRLQKYNFNFKIETSQEGLRSVIFTNSIDELDEIISESSRDLEILKRLELNQSVRQEYSYNKLETKFQNYLQTVLSIEIDEKSLIQLAEVLSKNQSEFEAFRNLILKNENPEKYQEMIYQNLDEFLKFMTAEHKLVSNLISQFSSITKGVYTIENEETPSGYNRSKSQAYRDTIPNCIRFESLREELLSELDISDIDVEIQSKSLSDFLSSNSIEQDIEFARKVKNELSDLDEIEDSDDYTEPEKIARIKKEETSLEEDIALILSLQASKEDLLNLTEALAESKQQYEEFKETYKKKSEVMRS